MCDFPIHFTGSPDALVAKAEKAISGIGGTFTGDAQVGQFDLSTPVGKISGSYQVKEQSLLIHIGEKPFFISCSQIEAQLKKALEGA